MKPRRFLPIGTPDRLRSPMPIEPIEPRRSGPLGDRVELALLLVLGAALLIRGCWPW